MRGHSFFKMSSFFLIGMPRACIRKRFFGIPTLNVFFRKSNSLNEACMFSAWWYSSSDPFLSWTVIKLDNIGRFALLSLVWDCSLVNLPKSSFVISRTSTNPPFDFWILLQKSAKSWMFPSGCFLFDSMAERIGTHERVASLEIDWRLKALCYQPIV